MSDNALQSSVTVDPATGFVEKNEKFFFGAKAKTLFLKALKDHGNQTAAADKAGVPFATVEEHLRIDLAFKRAFRATMLEMRHILEGKLYTTAMKGGTKEAKMWLEVFFPETYKPSKSSKPEKDSSVIDDLYKKSL